MNHYFDTKAIFLYAGFAFLLASILFQVNGRERKALFFLLCAGSCFFVSAALIYEVLNLWDERFHALVAKNLMDHPLKPTLYDDPIVPMAYDVWDKFHIWLHKQPLFMWQIAMSYKLFGVNEFALRLPGIVLSVAMLYAIYRSGKIVANAQVGYCAAFLSCTSFYWLELVCGWQELDQNDVAFVSYIALSFWAWLEYVHSGKKRWIVLAGIFSGCAVLCKWLVGLLVYSAWGIYSVWSNKFALKKYWPVVLAFCITLLVFMPWQVLIFKWYPAEAKVEYDFNLKHLTEPVDGHGGDAFYHFDRMKPIYGITRYVLFAAMAVFLWRMSNKKLAVSLFASVVAVYLFFTLVVTKMPSFTMAAWLPMLLMMGFFLQWLIGNFMKLHLHPALKKTVVALALGYIAWTRVDLHQLDQKHAFYSEPTACTAMLVHNKKILTGLDLPANTVLFNVNGRHYVEAMFYTGLPTYGFIPTEHQYKAVKNRNRRIAVFKPVNDSVPAYLSNDPEVIIIDQPLQRCE